MLVKFIESVILRVETTIVALEANSLWAERFHVYGFLGNSSKHSSYRNFAALHTTGYWLLFRNLIMHLTPINAREKGLLYDLCFALGILEATNQMTFTKVQGFIRMGKLSLHGSLLSIEAFWTNLNKAPREDIKDGVCGVPSIIKSISCFLRNHRRAKTWIDMRQLFPRAREHAELSFSNLQPLQPIGACLETPAVKRLSKTWRTTCAKRLTTYLNFPFRFSCQIWVRQNRMGCVSSGLHSRNTHVLKQAYLDVISGSLKNPIVSLISIVSYGIFAGRRRGIVCKAH